MGDETTWWKPFYEDLFGHVQLSPGDWTSRRETEAAMIEARLALQPGSEILDVPSGTGRIANELAARGHRVTGIDFHPRVLDEARKEAQSRGLAVTYQQGDMRALDAREAFDAALCFWGSFGYFDDAHNELFVTAVARALKPGGRFLIDTPAADSLPNSFRPRSWSWVDEKAGLRLLEETAFDPYSSRITTHWTLLGPNLCVERDSTIRLYTVRELDELFRRAGFARIEAYDGHQEGPYTMLSRRLLLVAWKAA
ncbi:MAG: class I SAM-dependent methyltransferase [Myxococcales bacterium]|nr:class I SAM-dependent methyltransferase [Myxococcales bacterium]